MKMLVMLALTAFIGTAVMGCRAEGEVDTAASVAAPR